MALALGLDGASRGRVLLLARTRGLITGSSSNWHADRKKLKSLVGTVRLRKVMPSALAFYGLGELMARGNDASVPRFARLEHLSSRKVHELLESLSAIARAAVPKKAHADMTCRSLLAAGEPHRELRRMAGAFLQHPPRGVPGFYGFGHALLSLLARHPKATGAWLRRARLPAELYEVIIGRVAGALRWRGPSESRDLARSLIRAGLPILQALGACALAGEGNEEDAFEFGPLYSELQSLGVSSRAAFRLAVRSVENVRVWRAVTGAKVRQATDRLQELGHNPEAAIGGRRNAEMETERIRTQLQHQEAERHRAEQRFERLAPALAAAFRAEPQLSCHIRDLDVNRQDITS